jgi:hypothetical protein
MSLDRINASQLTPMPAPARPSAPASTDAERMAPRARPDAASRSRAVETPAPARVASKLAPTEPTLPQEAPAGTDPALWSVLTSDERAFFAKNASLGPLTYGRIKAELPTAAPIARGARIDVRA